MQHTSSNSNSNSNRNRYHRSGADTDARSRSSSRYDTINRSNAKANEDHKDKEVIQLEALQTLINSVGNGQLPTHQTLPLAQRILSSSIAQTSSSNLSSSPNLSTSLVKKIQRHYSKNTNADSDEIRHVTSTVQNLYQDFTTSGNTDEGEILIVNNVLKILSRLAGTGRNLKQQQQQAQKKRSTKYQHADLGSTNKINKKYNDSYAHVPKRDDHDTYHDNSDINEPADSLFASRENQDHRTFNHVKMALQDEEQTILRECIHALQFINGDIIRFYSDTNDIGSDEDGNKNRWVEKEESPEEDHNEFNMSCTKTIQIRSGLLPLGLSPVLKVEHKKTRLLSTGSIDALHVCCEAGWLYSRIMNYVQFIHGRRNIGVVPRALASAFTKELQFYHSLLSSLEAQLFAQTQQRDDVNEKKNKELTSRQLMMQLRTPITQLRTMAIMIDGIEPSLNGGQLLTALYLHSIHGDMRHVELVNRILYSTSLPWYDLLYDWCMNGVLLSSSPSSSKTSSEFFIQEKVDMTSDDVWHGQYLLHKHQIPSLPSIGGGNGGLITESLANEILIVGKGINFIRKCLYDSKWSLDVQQLIPQKELEKFIREAKASPSVVNNVELFQEVKKLLGFHYDSATSRRLVRDLSGQCGEIITQSPLERTVTAAAQQVHKHILLSLFEEHHLLQHLKGLKEILFLGQGDFICSLIGGLNTEFESRGHDGTDGIYMHNMMGILHDALRSTNAKFLPQFVLQRIYVKLMSPENAACQRYWIDADQKVKEKFDGWDIFSLGYEIDAPLTAVVHQSAMKKYNEMFNLLFRLKRIEWMLNSTWRQSTVLNHALQCVISKYGDMTLGPSSSIKRGNEISRMKQLLRTFSLTRQMMLHFVTNLQSYLMFEVLESGWKSLVSKLGNSTTLDEVISSHDEYLDEIVSKSLLTETIGSATKKGTDELGRQLRLVLTIAYRFCKTHEQIFNEALQSIDSAAERQRGAERRSKAGKWGFEKFDPDVEGQHFYNLSDEDTLKGILSISQNFDMSLRNLLSMLNEKVNGTMAETVLTSPSQSPYPLNLSDESLAQNDDSLRFLTFRLDFSEFYS